MKIRLYVTTIGFLLAVSAAACNRSSSTAPKSSDLEVPPSLSGAVAKAQNVSFCELISKPEQYSNKVVRTEAVFYANHENSALYSPECPDKTNYVWTDFDPSYDYSDESVKKKFNELRCPQVPCPSGKGKVTVVGRFEGPNQQGYGHLNGYRFRLVIMRIVAAEKVP